MAKKVKTKKKSPKKNQRKVKAKVENPPSLKFKEFVLTIIILFVIGAGIYGFIAFKKYLFTAPIFTIVKMRSNVAINTVISKQNIFSVDLKEVENSIRSRHPEFEDVRVSRNFPNILQVTVKERVPFFQLEKKGYYQLDDDGFIIKGPSSVPYDEIVVHPVLSQKSKFYIGRQVLFAYFEDVINLLRQLRRYNASKIYNISELHIPSLNNIYFILDNIEVRIGKGDYAEKIDTLFERIVPQFSQDLDKIEYVDLRFKDYVIGYKK